MFSAHFDVRLGWKLHCFQKVFEVLQVPSGKGGFSRKMAGKEVKNGKTMLCYII